MQKRNLVSLAVLLAVAFLGLGCRNHLLSQPTFESPKTVGGGVSGGHQASGSAVSFGAPANLVSTQGHYREITLSWEPVWNSARYYIYRADTQFDTFVQVGETADAATSYTTKVGAGADYYYRIAAVSANGKVSPFSEIVRGTSLAEPIVSAIEGVAGKEDEEVVVYWYMGNVSAYQQQVRYHVVCEDPTGKEIARVVVDGSKHSKTEAVITGLNPNKDYKYKVEAYHVSAQDKVEASQPIDAATARRLRPDAPVELRVDQGLSVQEINLSFKLPSLVDVALPGGLYDQKPLYFKIYRRERREGVTDTEQGWQLLKADFGKTETQPGEGEVQKVNFGDGDVEYTPGSIVTFTDKTAGLKRGVQYEYKVQSFSYTPDREITSNFSYSIETGWLLAPATFSTGTYTAVKNAEGTANVSASLSFQLDWDDMGLAGQYHFILEETRDALEKDGATPGSPCTLDPTFDTKEELHSYIRKFEDLSLQKDRGYYHYSLGIYLDGNPTPIETLESLGRAIVTDSVNLPVIKLFSATEGYQDKIELSWQYKDTEEYRLAYSDGSGAISYIEHDQLVAGFRDADTLTYEHRVGAGKDNSYILSVKNDEGTVDTPVLPGSSSQAPVPRAKGLAYDSIEVEWDDVPAQEFTVSARYDDSSLASSHAIDPQKVTGSADGHSPTPRSVAFVQPSGYDDARVSGKPLTVTVEATVPVKRNILELSGETGTSYHQRTEDVNTQTISGSVSTRTMGPALVNAAASVGTYSDKITLTWDKVEGAEAYVILRNSLHISSKSSGNDLLTEFQNTDRFIVTNVDSDAPTVTLDPAPTDMNFIQKYLSVAKTDTGFTLTDMLCQEESEDVTLGKWLRSQSQLSWGAPYEYIVLPLLSSQDAIEYDYEAAPAVATVDTVTLTSVRHPAGATKGYAWNVKATKGTYSEDGENSGVKLTWTRPWANPGGQYAVYRADSSSKGNDDAWERLSSPVASNATEFVDKSATPGIMYQYMVAPATNNPQDYPYKNAAYKEHFDKIVDEDYAGERLANGFMLPQIEFDVTRDKRGHSDTLGGQVRLTWHAPTIADQTNYLFDGFLIEILNHNLSDEWQEMLRLTFNDNVQKLASYGHNFDNSSGKLKVLRDYKLWFRIRTFTFDDAGEYVYSKSPAFEWDNVRGDATYDTTHIKWGARSLSADEWIKCTTLAMSIGLERAKNNRAGATPNDQWSASHGVGINNEASPGSGSSSLNAFKNRSTIIGIPSGDVYHQIKFNDYKPVMTTRSGRQVTFLTIQASSDDEALYGETYDGFAIRAATDYCTTGVAGDFNSTPRQITIVGPSDVPGLYDAKISFYKFNPVRENGGGYLRLYPGHDSNDDGSNYFTRKSGSVTTPFPCNDNNSAFQNDTDDWK